MHLLIIAAAVVLLVGYLLHRRSLNGTPVWTVHGYIYIYIYERIDSACG